MLGSLGSLGQAFEAPEAPFPGKPRRRDGEPLASVEMQLTTTTSENPQRILARLGLAGRALTKGQSEKGRGRIERGGVGLIANWPYRSPGKLELV